jgi:uncharacterized protein YhbP (UPF0306 family)
MLKKKGLKKSVLKKKGVQFKKEIKNLSKNVSTE